MSIVGPQQSHTKWTGYLASGASVAKGDVVCLNAAGTRYVKATTANLALQSLGSVGVATAAGDGDVPGHESFPLQFCGMVPNSITGLGAGADGQIYVSTTGRLSRTSNGATVGVCDEDGNALVNFAAGGVSAISLPFNVASPNPQDFGPGEEYISYGAAGSTLPTLGSTIGSLISLSDTIGSSEGDRYGIITWRAPGVGDLRIMSVASTSTSKFLFLGDTQLIQTTLTSSFTGIVGAEDSLFIGLGPTGNAFSGLLASRRLAIGTTGLSNHASFGSTASAGPMIKLHKATTLPTGNPVGNPDNPAVWIYFEEGGSDFLHVKFPSGNVGSIADVNGTLLTGSSPVLTTPQINDTSSDHQYIFAVNELAADRTVTLPLLTGNDEFVFKDHTVTMTNKTLTSPTLGGTPTLSGASTSTSNNAKGTCTDANPVNVQTTDATETTLETVAHATSDSMLVASWLVSAIKDDGSQGAGYSVSCAIKNNSGTLSHCTGSPQVTVLGEDDSAWAATADISGTNVRLRVTGNASDTVQWAAVRTSLAVIP